jgi:hypothetical protein
MNVPRVVSIALALAAVSMLATGTLGFTSVSAERGVSVNVVESEKAYVGVTACAPTNGNGNGNSSGNGNGKGNAAVYVWVTNQYSSDVTVERIEGGGSEISTFDSSDESISSGGEREYPFPDNASEVTVDVVGDGFDATITAEVTAPHRSECKPGSETV